jgi:hypothetical protein
VDIRGEGGAVLAATALADGTPDPTHRGCAFPFSVARLPAAGSYTVQVGARTAMTYPTADLASAGWRIELNLGIPDPA